MVERYHYSRIIPKGRNLCWGVWIDGTLYAVAIYGNGVNCYQAGFLARKTGLAVTPGNHVELKRLVRVEPRSLHFQLTKLLANAHHWLLSLGYKYVVSFSDPEWGHTGSVYRAANFAHLGRTQAEWHVKDKNGKRQHRRLAYRYARRKGCSISEAREELGLTRVQTVPRDRWFLALERSNRKTMNRLRLLGPRQEGEGRMSYINKLTTNVKSPDGSHYSVGLGQYTLLVGDNESGKSAIAESAQLARTGSAYGLLYRDKPIKDGSLLSALVPEGREDCSILAALDSGETCEWSLTRGKRPKRSGPNGAILSVAELHAIMAGNSETQGKYFWRALCEPMDVKDLLDQVPDALHEALVLVCPLDGQKVNLPDLVERIGKFQREQSNVARAGQIALESLGTVQSVSDDELAGVWDAMHRANLRDVVRELYLEYKSDPSLQAREVIRHLVKMLGGEGAVSRIPSTEEVGADLAEALLNRRLSRVAVAAGKGELRAAGLKEGLKKLKDVVVQILFASIHRIAADFSDRVSAFLPEGEELFFSIDSKARTLTIGLARNGGHHVALSGSTEARVLAAIASALSDEEALVVVDDRMWDSGTLSRTMEVLEKAPCQVLVMSTIKPRGRRRASWTYVEIDRTEGEPLEVSSDRSGSKKGKA